MLDNINSTLRRVPTWVVYLLGLVLAAWVIFDGLSQTDPVRGIEWGLGIWSLRLLIVALVISPLRWVGLNLLRFRRQLGLVAFAFVCLHLLSWLTIDMGLRWSQILHDLYKRWYILIGMSAFILLTPLAITSNGASIRSLGAKTWNRLHKLAYPATILAVIHFLMVGKVYTAEMLIYAGIVAVLLTVRLVRNGPQSLVWA